MYMISSDVVISSVGCVVRVNTVTATDVTPWYVHRQSIPIPHTAEAAILQKYVKQQNMCTAVKQDVISM